jgi:photoactive yellow protein
MYDGAWLFDVLDRLPIGVVVLDPAGKVLLYNRYEESLAGRPQRDVLGRDFFTEVAPCLEVQGLGPAYREQARAGAVSLDAEACFAMPSFDEPRRVHLRLRSLELGEDPCAILLVEDASTRQAQSKAREVLSALLVHDLKNPLSNVIQALSMLEGRSAVRDDAAAKDMTERALRGAHRLDRMIMGLLDVSRLENGAVRLRRETTDLCELAAHVTRDSAPLAQQRGVALVADLPKEPIVAEVDPELLRRALDNLVDNAIRHAETVSIVEVRADAQLGSIVEVYDDGPGIPDAYREAIFDKFTQLDTPRRTEHNRGLGLTLVKLVARAHRGEVSVSCPLEGGSVFRLALPSR